MEAMLFQLAMQVRVNSLGSAVERSVRVMYRAMSRGLKTHFTRGSKEP